MIALLLAAVMHVTFVEGPVLVNAAEVTVGQELHAGDTIDTAAGGRIEFETPNGSLVRLGEGARLTVKESVSQKAFSARLFIGNLWTKVHKLIEGESYSVETENGVAGVRGTEFRIEAEQGKPDLLRVYEGAVHVGESRVEPGHELRFRKGEKPLPAAFDPATEKGHKFMDWVRSRPMKDGKEPGAVHHHVNPERENRVREKHGR